MIQLYSFDIFDTLITRCTEHPSDVFWYVQEELKQNSLKLPEYIVDSFATVRIEAESNARAFYEKNEITIDDIYRILSQMADLSDDQIAYIKEIEIQKEKEFARPIEENIRQLKELLRENKRVVLISDMYLSEGIIRELLTTIDMCFENISMYVSSRYNATKASGELYIKVKEIEEIEYGEWHHIGDNHISDVIVPRMLGILAVDFDKTKIVSNKEKNNYREYENQLSETKKNLEEIEQAKNVIKVGAISGLILYSFVKWLIDIAIKRNIEILYFMARDGYILKAIADLIIDNEEKNIQTRYIYSSRKAWRPQNRNDETALKGYIKQNVDCKKNIGFVDLYASGESIKRMGELCELQYDYYCFAMIGLGVLNSDRWYTYSSANRCRDIEVLCRAPHGQTLGYELVNGVWKAVLDNCVWNEKEHREYRRYLDSILEVSKFAINKKNINYKALCYELLRLLFVNPDKDVADFIGEIHHSGNNDEMAKFAPLYSKDDLVDIHISGTKKYHGENFEYSLKRLPREKQIEYENEMIEWYKEIINEKSIPTQKIKKVIIYGAGKNGKKIFEKLARNDNYEIISWVDQNYEKMQTRGYPIEPLKDAIKKDYDYLWVTVLAKKEIVKKYIIECGANPRKIVFDL
jgi:predicted HAD superfamily hydrolase